MRSTLLINSNTALNNILDNYARISKIQRQMSSGRRVNDPSDDPLATNEGMRLDTILSKLGQFNRNIDSGKSFLTLSDGTLGSVTDLIRRAESLTIGAATETTTHEMRQANLLEVSNITQQLVTLANQTQGDRFVFAGTKTKTTPYEIVGSRYVLYNGNDKDIRAQIDAAVNIPVNVTGGEVFGNTESVLTSRDLSPDVNFALSRSTRLEDLNNGLGVPAGSINIKYSSYPDAGVTVDLSTADTVEDVIDLIEEATATASAELDVAIPGNNLKRDRYVSVSINADNNGLDLIEVDPSGDAFDPDLEMEVSDVGGNRVAQLLGIDGTVTYTNVPAPPAAPVSSTPVALEGGDLDPLLSTRTVLADLDSYGDGAFSVINGAQPGSVPITELDDTNNRFEGWTLAGLAEGVNTDVDGKLYVRLSGAASPYSVEVFRGEERLAGQLVATGTSGAGSTVILSEANGSGLSGTVRLNSVGANLPLELDLQATFDPTFRSPVSINAFEKDLREVAGETLPDVISNFRMRGLERGHDPVNGLGTRWPDTTTVDGEFELTVTRVVGVSTTYQVDVSHPTNGIVATGTLDDNNISRGEVLLNGVAGFEHLKGSVFVDWSDSTPNDLATRAYDMKATFATVGDVINAIDNSGTYTEAGINKNGRALDIVSKLGGAYLTVTERVDHAPVDYDDVRQINDLSLDGVVVGQNTDLDGKIYASVELDIQNDDAGQISNLALLGVQQGVNTDASGNVYITIDPTAAGLPADPQVIVYRDAARTVQVASGDFETAATDPLRRVTLEEVAGSGLNGTFELPDPPATIKPDNDIVVDANVRTIRFYSDAARTNQVAGGSGDIVSGNVSIASVNNSGLTGVFSFNNNLAERDYVIPVHGYRLTGDTGGGIEDVTPGGSSLLTNLPQLDELDLDGISKGVNTDADGNLFAKVNNAFVTADDAQYLNGLDLTGPVAGADYDANGKMYAVIDSTVGANGELRLYADAALTTLSASGNINADGTVTVGPGGSGMTGTAFVAQPTTDQSGLEIQAWDTVNATAAYSVSIYRDSAQTELVTTGQRDSNTGQVVFESVTLDGVDTNLTGEVYLAARWPMWTGRDSFIQITPPRGLLNSGQVRQQNLWATLNDVQDAMEDQDADRLHDLIGEFDVDQKRVLNARAEIGARSDRMQLLYVRHEEEVINFQKIRADRIDLDYAEAVTDFQAAQNVFEASLRTTGQIIPLSLVDFI